MNTDCFASIYDNVQDMRSNAGCVTMDHRARSEKTLQDSLKVTIRNGRIVKVDIVPTLYTAKAQTRMAISKAFAASKATKVLL
jgi:hypothetical protein